MENYDIAGPERRQEEPGNVTPEYDPEELRQELERAAAGIDEEIRLLEEGRFVSRKDLQILFGEAG